MLTLCGARCATITKAMPLSAGIGRSSPSNASMPPADAPTPTMNGLSTAAIETVSSLLRFHAER